MKKLLVAMAMAVSLNATANCVVSNDEGNTPWNYGQKFPQVSIDVGTLNSLAIWCSGYELGYVRTQFTGIRTFKDANRDQVILWTGEDAIFIVMQLQQKFNR